MALELCYHTLGLSNIVGQPSVPGVSPALSQAVLRFPRLVGKAAMVQGSVLIWNSVDWADKKT